MDDHVNVILREQRDRKIYMKLLLLNFDLILSSKIQSIASGSGSEAKRVKSIEEANLALENDSASILLLHLKPERISDLEKVSFPTRTVGVYSHVEEDCRIAAESKCLKFLWTRSMLEKNLPGLFMQ